jgi:serine/threonine-protein kinase
MVPPALDRVVVAATHRERDKRTPDARTMRLEVDRAAGELPPASSLEELASSVPPVDETPADRATTVTIPRTLSPKARRRRRLQRSWTLLSLLVVLGVLGWAAWTYVIPHMTTVPDLVGRQAEQAQDIAEARGLDFEQRLGFSDAPPGEVVSQSRRPGTEVEEGSALSVVVSKGPELVDVPILIGLTEARAKRRIRDERLEVGKLQHVYDDQVPEGRVISQSPPANAPLEVGEPVDLVVSKGKAPVQLPSVVGQDADEATSLLRDLGLQVSVSQDFSATVDEGFVISQSPGAGDVVPAGSTVTIVISKGPREFPMPDVVGMTEAEATARLESLDLIVKVTQVPGSTGNEVVSTKPSEGKTVQQGDTVTIYVA